LSLPPLKHTTTVSKFLWEDAIPFLSTGSNIHSPFSPVVAFKRTINLGYPPIAFSQQQILLLHAFTLHHLFLATTGGKALEGSEAEAWGKGREA
jgi:hypothetical protein